MLHAQFRKSARVRSMRPTLMPSSICSRAVLNYGAGNIGNARSHSSRAPDAARIAEIWHLLESEGARSA